MNMLSESKRDAVLALLSRGHGLREIERMTGIHRDTIMRLTRQPSLDVMRVEGCELIENLSSAYCRRKRAWLESGGTIPEGMIVDSNCGTAHCITFGHCYLRRKIDITTARPLFAHCIPQILRLAIGETVGVAIKSDQDDEAIRLKLSSLLRRKPFMYFRWAARLRDDRVVIVRKLGTWASKKKSYETKTFAQSPAYQQIFEEIPLNDTAVCMGCGANFEAKGRTCCSVECSRKYKKIAAELAKL